MEITQCINYSNFPPEHPCYNSDRKRELGLLKSETGARVMKESIALKSKMYSLHLEEDDQISRCKGVPVHHQILLMHQDFKRALTGEYPPPVDCCGIRNIRRQVSLISKHILSKVDDKRYYLDSKTTVGYFHSDSEWPRLREVEEREGEGE